MPRPSGVSQPAPVALIVLRAKRIQRGLTLQELSNRSGVPLNTICKIERGSRTPSDTELGALAWALDVTPPAELLREVAVNGNAEPQSVEQPS